MNRKYSSHPPGFSTIVIGLIIAVILLGTGAGFFFLNQSDSPTPPQPTTNETAEDTNAGADEVTSTFPDIIGRGENLECDWRIPVAEGDSPFNTGKLWTTGNQGRSTITGTISGMMMEGNAIYKDEVIYSWIDTAGTKMGFMFTQAELSEMNAGMTEEERQQAEQIRKEMIFNCGPWTPDATKFVLPTDVQFREN